MTRADDWRAFLDNNVVRWGTDATHRLGDMPRSQGDFFAVTSETDDDYVGYWLTGFGFVEVHFPKPTTRELSHIERKWLAEHPVEVS
jgi:hypothetical protein